MKSAHRVLSNCFFIHNYAADVLAQIPAPPDTPTGVTATALGPRAMRIQWSHSGNFGGSLLIRPDPDGFRITLRATSERMSVVTEIPVSDSDARNHTAVGLVPYQYTSSLGVSYSVSIVARSRAASSEEVSAKSITLPRKMMMQLYCKISQNGLATILYSLNLLSGIF